MYFSPSILKISVKLNAQIKYRLVDYVLQFK